MSGVIGTVIDTLVSVNHRAEEALSSASGALGDKLFGPTAESEYKNAEVIAPEASTQPTTVGRRSKHPDGNDPFHASDDSSKADEKA